MVHLQLLKQAGCSRLSACIRKVQISGSTNKFLDLTGRKLGSAKQVSLEGPETGLF